MPFCPKCKYEYNFGVSVCPDCNEELVSSLPGKGSGVPGMDEYSKFVKQSSSNTAHTQPSEEWVPIAGLSHQSAELITGALESEEIPVVVTDRSGYIGQLTNSGGSIWSGQSSVGAVIVLVPRENVAAADLIGHGILSEEWERSRLIDPPE